MDGRGGVVIPTPFALGREFSLDQLFGGLEYYVQFPQHEAPKKKLVEIGSPEKEFIVSAYSVFFANLIVTSFRRKKNGSHPIKDFF